VLSDRIRVRNDNLKRARKRNKQLQKAYALGEINGDRVQQSLQRWKAHLQHGDTWRLRENIFSTLKFKKEVH